MDDLRDQFAQEWPGLEEDIEPPARRFFLGLEPWQRFVLALFLFLDIAIVGLMVLLITGRIGLPF